MTDVLLALVYLTVGFVAGCVTMILLAAVFWETAYDDEGVIHGVRIGRIK